MDLKFTFTVTGTEGSDDVKMSMDFDPPMGKEDDHAWDNSAVGHVAAEVLDLIRRIKGVN